MAEDKLWCEVCLLAAYRCELASLAFDGFGWEIGTDVAGEPLLGEMGCLVEVMGDFVTGEADDFFIGFRVDEEGPFVVDPRECFCTLSPGSDRHTVNPKDLLVGIDHSLLDPSVRGCRYRPS